MLDVDACLLVVIISKDVPTSRREVLSGVTSFSLMEGLMI